MYSPHKVMPVYMNVETAVINHVQISNLVDSVLDAELFILWFCLTANLNFILVLGGQGLKECNN